MPYLLLGLGALVLLLILGRLLSNANPATLARIIKGIGGALAAAFALLMLARGGAALAIPAGVFALWLLSDAFSSSTPSVQGPSPSNQTSKVRTDTLEMMLDLQTGEVFGRVLGGQFAGHAIEDLSPQQLANLWAECQFSDPQSAQIIEAYLDRRHPTWREDMAKSDTDNERAGSGDTGSQGGQRSNRTRKTGAAMTVNEAYEILGLNPGADRDAVTTAHKSLMLKYHPDRGGSDYFAAKLNEAKTVLLAHLDK